MKKIILASLLAIGSIAYAGTTGHDTRALPSLGLDASESCDMPVNCSSLSPLARSVCILKGIGQFGLTALCGAGCVGAYSVLTDKRRPLNIKSKMISTGIALGVLIIGADTLNKCVRNISTAITD